MHLTYFAHQLAAYRGLSGLFRPFRSVTKILSFRLAINYPFRLWIEKAALYRFELPPGNKHPYRREAGKSFQEISWNTGRLGGGL